MLSVMDKLKNLFQRAEVPDDARDIYLKAANSRELLKGLEAQRGRNEMELREHEDQLIALEKSLLLEEDRIRKGGLSPTEEATILRRIERYGNQRDSLEKLVGIYNGNVNFHINLIAKIQEMEAMRSRGVSEDQIDRLIGEVEENLEIYKRESLAGENTAQMPEAVNNSDERKRLAEIKNRIIGPGPESGQERPPRPHKEADLE
jgi:hypothetical protein